MGILDKQPKHNPYRSASIAAAIALLCAMASPQWAYAQDTSSQTEAVARKSEAKDVLARFFDAEGKYSKDSSEENWQAVAAFIDPEFVLYQADSLPFGGVWRGPDGFKAWMKVMADNFTSFGGRDPRIIVGGDTVIIVLTLVGEARKTGQHFEMPLAQVIKIRNGRLLEVRPFYWDTAAASKALGHDPK